MANRLRSIAGKIGRFVVRQLTRLGILSLGLAAGWGVRSATGPKPWSHLAAQRVRGKSPPPSLAGGRSAGEAEVLAALRQWDRPLDGLLALQKALAAGQIHDFAAVARLIEASPFLQRDEVMSRLLDEWIDLDPAGATSHLVEQGRNDEVVKKAFQRWLATQPDAALDFARTDQKALTLFHTMSPGLLGSLDAIGGSAAAWLRFATAIGDRSLRASAAIKAVERRLAEHPGANVEDILGEFEGTLSRSDISGLRSTLKWKLLETSGDISAALVAGSGLEINSEPAAQAFRRLSGKSADDALTVALQRPDLRVPVDLMSPLAKAAWARGPEAVVALLRSPADFERRDQLEGILARGLDALPFGKSWARVSAPGPEADRLRARVLGRAGPAEGAALVATQPVEFQSQWGASIAGHWASRDPDAAAALFLSSGAAHRNDPAAAVEAKLLTEKIVDADPDKAATWVNRMPPGPVRDRAVLALVNAGAKDSAESAAQWVATMTDPVTRSVAQRVLDRAQPAKASGR